MVSAVPHTVDIEHDQAGLTDLLAMLRPDAVVNCASYQSPWEPLRRRSAWSSVVRTGGIGATLPLQAALVAKVAKAVVAGAPDALLLNASYPDVVNPLLTAAGLPVLCGLGNVTVLWSALRAHTGRDVRVLGHHYHLHEPEDGQDEAIAWLGAERLDNVGSRLHPLRSLPRQSLNAVSGEAAGTLLRATLAGDEVAMSVPGPLGLPGGYPVRVSGGRVDLDLPPDMSTQDAVAYNRRFSREEGVDIDESGQVSFVGAAARVLSRVAPDVAEGFHAADVEQAATRLQAVAAELRAEPEDVGSET
jgi:hypothetical protein